MFSPRRSFRTLAILAAVGLLVCAAALFRTGGADSYMPHGHCYLWNAKLVWLHVGSDFLIGAAYLAISTTLGALVWQSRRELPFHWIIIAFGVFIVACGMTHFVEVWTVWHPAYWIGGGVKLVTAVASVGTAVLLPPLLPKIRDLLEAARIAREGKALLEAEVTERAKAAAALQEANARLEMANKEMEGFTHTVSHDLRAPLRHMKWFGERLRTQTAGQLDPDSQRCLETVMNSANRLSQLMDQLLDFTRLGRQALNRERVDLNDLTAEVRRKLRTECVGRSILWDVEDLPSVDADPDLLELVLLNLIQNALKFTRNRDEARIAVRAETRDGECVISVRDNGVGFDQQYAGKLFGVFQRLHRAEEFEGTGIGLANVARMVHLHGGRVWAEGAVGQGATFYFSLPNACLP